MTLFFQVVSFAVLAAAVVGWSIWVYDSNRPIDAPEYLRQIHVHGLADGQGSALSQAITVGVIGQIAEHKRVVQFVNTAAGAGPKIQSLVRVSQPAPGLIDAPQAPESLDITIEFAGSKVATRGLQSIFAGGERRGGLSLSLLLEQGEEGELAGLASASFPGNSTYGFSLGVEGQAHEIAEQIAMRFVQAHYAAADSFFSALQPEEFRAIWTARREAAKIALRTTGGSGLGDRKLQREAQEVYETIAPLANRYIRRPDLQRLAAYLTSVGERFELARTHLAAVHSQSGDEDEKEWLERQIAALEADAATQRGSRLAAATPRPSQGTAVPDETSGLSANERMILHQPEFQDNGLAALARRASEAPEGRTVTVALVLSPVDGFGPFAERVRRAASEDGAAEIGMRNHTEQVVSLIATLAPRAEVVTYRAINDNGAANFAAVAESLSRAFSSGADVIAVPLGPLQGEPIEEVITAGAGKESLFLAAAGNTGASKPARAGASLPGVVYVGATEDGSLAPYSDRGPDIKVFAPGRSLVFDSEGTGEMRGSTVAMAVTAATAANLKVLSDQPLDAPALEEKLLEHTRSTRGGPFLDLAQAE